MKIVFLYHSIWRMVNFCGCIVWYYVAFCTFNNRHTFQIVLNRVAIAIYTAQNIQNGRISTHNTQHTLMYRLRVYFVTICGKIVNLVCKYAFRNLVFRFLDSVRITTEIRKKKKQSTSTTTANIWIDLNSCHPMRMPGFLIFTRIIIIVHVFIGLVFPPMVFVARLPFFARFLLFVFQPSHSMLPFNQLNVVAFCLLYSILYVYAMATA